MLPPSSKMSQNKFVHIFLAYCLDQDSYFLDLLPV